MSALLNVNCAGGAGGAGGGSSTPTREAFSAVMTVYESSLFFGIHGLGLIATISPAFLGAVPPHPKRRVAHSSDWRCLSHAEVLAIQCRGAQFTSLLT